MRATGGEVGAGVHRSSLLPHWSNRLQGGAFGFEAFRVGMDAVFKTE